MVRRWRLIGYFRILYYPLADWQSGCEPSAAPCTAHRAPRTPKSDTRGSATRQKNTLGQGGRDAQLVEVLTPG